MTVTDDFLTNNRAYAGQFDKGDLPLPPAKKIAIVACMDARLDPARVLGLEEGLRMLTFTDDDVKAQITKGTGIRPPFALESFGDLDDDVRQSRARIQASPFIPHTTNVRGFVYQVESGRLREVS